jgi:APA family basic amino acid/polyamine antiporter
MGVVVLYLAANVVYVGALGANGLAEATTPSSSVMRLALGERGARLMAVGIGISTLGFLSQSMLTAPRVYFAMAEDKLFFKSVAWVGPRSRVPVVAIALQGTLATVIALSQKYEQILDYVVSVDFIAYGLTATCLFAFRHREAQAFAGSTARAQSAGSIVIGYRVPGHPYTTVFFTAVCWAVVAGTVYSFPRNTVIGLGIVLAGIPVYFFWRWWRRDGARLG